MISIIIPVFNEEKRLKEGVEKIFAFINKQSIKYEVIIVNDGSNDLTGKMLPSLQKKFLFKVYSHEKNLGKGAAVRTGISNALGDIIIFTDIDLSVPIEFIDKFIAELTKRDDIIIGTRVVKNSKIVKKQSFLRELLGGTFTVLANLLLGVGVSDFTCGFKLFKKEAAQKIFIKQQITRWAFDAESLFLAKKFGYHIKEVPVIWRHFEGSKVNVFSDLTETLFDLFKIRLNDLRRKYD